VATGAQRRGPPKTPALTTLLALDTEQGLFIICASIVEACKLGDPFNAQHRSRMTTLFAASTSAQLLHDCAHARCAMALVMRPAPRGIVDG
jgi:hypothetical protein